MTSCLISLQSLCLVLKGREKYGISFLIVFSDPDQLEKGIFCMENLQVFSPYEESEL